MAPPNILSHAKYSDRGPDSTVARPSAFADAGLGDGGERAPPRPDLRVALHLLDGAAERLQALHSRCESVEAQLADAAQRSQAEIAQAQAKQLEAERRAQRLEFDLYDAGARLKEVEGRAKTAEERLEAAERRAVVAEESTLEARSWLNSFYQQINEKFGQHVQPRPSRAAA